MMKLQNRLILLGLSAVVAAGFVYSQIHIHEKNRKELREIAREIALNWKQKLNLTEQQTLMLEDVIIAYTIRKNEILNSDSSEKIKIQKLQQVQVREHRHLRKILTEKEFDAYVGINNKIPNRIMDSLSTI